MNLFDNAIAQYFLWGAVVLMCVFLVVIICFVVQRFTKPQIPHYQIPDEVDHTSRKGR